MDCTSHLNSPISKEHKRITVKASINDTPSTTITRLLSESWSGGTKTCYFIKNLTASGEKQFSL